MTTAPSQPSAGGALPRNRVERRKAQTRYKLIAATRAMLADDTAAQASIQEITDTADVGFGSLYNHFSSKAELFEAAVDDVLDELGDCSTSSASTSRPRARLRPVGPSDPAPVPNRPEMAAVLIRHGMHYMESPRGLAPRVLRDIQAGVAAGRFQPTEPRLARAAVAGALLAALQLALSDPDLVDDAAIDRHAEQILRMLGTPYDDAHTLAHAPLPVAELPDPLTPARHTGDGGVGGASPLHRARTTAPSRPFCRVVRSADQRAPRALVVDIATERTWNARTISARPPVIAKIPTSQTSVRMPLPGQISSSTPKTTFRTPAASVQPHAFDPRRGPRTPADLLDPNRIAQR